MKSYLTWIVIFFTLICQSSVMYAACKEGDKPKLVNPLKDYDIISTNIASIPTAPAFSGTHLNYSFSAHPKSKKNKITIDHKTGLIHIDANKKDKFDLVVKAKNNCGSVTSSFNVIIDEEE